MLLALLVGNAKAMTFTKKYSFSKKNRFLFATKFAIGEGGYGRFQARARLEDPYNSMYIIV